MASSTSRGASGVLFALIFVLLSIWATREMRIGPVNEKVGDLMMPAVNSKYIKTLANTELRTRYTGIEAVDFGLRFLVVAFLPGALGIDQGQKLQQAHFLISFFPIIAIFSVEAGRKRNAWSLIYFTSIWALLYQTVGGAIIIPLYGLAYLKVSSSADYWTPASRSVPVAYAKALLPSLILGYLIPTILIYLPYSNVFITQGHVALWQPAPIIINILLLILAPILSAGQTEPKTKPDVDGSTDDVKHLQRVYILSFVVGAASHWAAIAICFLSSDPNLTFTHAFWPRRDLWIGRNINPSLSEGLLHIFQMDFWIIFASCLVWAYAAVLDVNRVTKSFVPASKALVVMVLNTALFGPAATIAAMWYSRESTLASLQKSKAA